MAMWHQLILYSDPEWTVKENDAFFHYLLNNAASRAAVPIPMAKPAQRKRAKKRKPSATVTNDEGVGYIEVSPLSLDPANNIQFIDGDPQFIDGDNNEQFQLVYSVP